MQVKAGLEIKNSGLGTEELSEKKQLPKDIIDRFEETKRRTKADTQKRQSISKTKKRKLKKWEKTNEKIWRDKKREMQDESDYRDKNIAEGVVQKGFVFFKKNLNRIANLDQKTCKKKAMKWNLGKDNTPRLLHKINKCKLSKARQSKPYNSSRPWSWLSCCKNSKVVCFRWVYFSLSSLSLFLFSVYLFIYKLIYFCFWYLLL